MVGQPVGVFYIPRCLGLTPALDENGNAIEGRYIYNLDQTIDGKEGLDTMMVATVISPDKPCRNIIWE